MTAEVSTLLERVVEGYKDEGEGKKTELVTRDLLGGCAAAEVDLELRVPAAWESRVSPSSEKVQVQHRKLSPAPRHLHDLNLSPPSLSATSLGLKPPPPATSAAPVAYHSACTLEKVRSALERESRLVTNSRPALLPRPDVGSPSSSPPSSTSSSFAVASTTVTTTTSSSTKRRAADRQEEEEEAGATTGSDAAGGREMAVAACPECLLYVLVCKVDPRCPRCAAHVPVSELRKKKPRFDLNFSLQPGNNNDS
ncbi:hypothetical protein Cni_G27631 [Canna indica]|uniref:GIR1-like zinc ribbon domain-containing protein n=1 Tax=Canna indica TaxID=4628 RepID=A0AAQ3L232_9LILI|nr:hypothetical protein Cni_G27631 [Canna indica]